MTVQDDIFTLGKKKFNQVKALVEELEVQMALGKAEARKTFENERKNFAEYVRERKEALRNATTEVAKDKTDLFQKFEVLEEKLMQETAETKAVFESQKKAILKAIYEVEFAIKEYYGDLANDVQDALEAFKTKLDGYRINLALGHYADEGNLEAKKMELRESIGGIKEILSRGRHHHSKI
ncbi:MAG: hypothetical protein IPL65_20300 [Lewinellaceae bacterium]|nr:hypothetical protein [Lewinellaceae bacterium]